MSRGYLYEDQYANLKDADFRDEFEATLYGPGDRVVPVSPDAPECAGSGVARGAQALREVCARAGVEVLTVKAAVACDEGALQEFEEIAGRWNMALVRDVNSVSNYWGCLLVHDGETWFVPFEQEAEKVEAGGSINPMPISPNLHKRAVWSFSGRRPWKSRPLFGEFSIMDCEDCQYVLVGYTMYGGVGEDWIVLAEEAIERHRSLVIKP